MNFDATMLLAQTETIPGRMQAGPLYMIVFTAVAIAVALVGFGVQKEREGGKKFVKYLSIPILTWLAYFGLPFYNYVSDPVTKSIGLVGGKSVSAYYMAFLLPAVLLVAIVAFCIYWDKIRKASEDY